MPFKYKSFGARKIKTTLDDENRFSVDIYGIKYQSRSVVFIIRILYRRGEQHKHCCLILTSIRRGHDDTSTFPYPLKESLQYQSVGYICNLKLVKTYQVSLFQYIVNDHWNNSVAVVVGLVLLFVTSLVHLRMNIQHEGMEMHLLLGSSPWSLGNAVVKEVHEKCLAAEKGKRA
jgi:hypothetical protein